MCRDISWNVNFEVTVNGETSSFEDLSETEQHEILKSIENDYYSGTFLGDIVD